MLITAILVALVCAYLIDEFRRGGPPAGASWCELCGRFHAGAC